MKLYYVPGACSLAPHIAAREARIPFDLEMVDLETKKTERGVDFFQVNPKGYVPALELEDGTMLTEGAAILLYLADQRPERALAPPCESFARYRLLEWLLYLSAEIHKTYSALFSKTEVPDRQSIAADRIKRLYILIDEHLGKSQFLLGDTFTIADCYLFVTLYWARWVHLDLQHLAHLESFYARVAARPSVKEALAAEGLGVL